MKNSERLKLKLYLESTTDPDLLALIEAGDAKALAAALNKVQPGDGSTIPAPVTLSGIFQIVRPLDPAGTVAAAQQFRSLLPLINEAVAQNNRQAIQDYAVILLSVLNAEAQAAIAEAVAATVPAPGRSLLARAGIGPATVADVRAALGA